MNWSAGWLGGRALVGASFAALLLSRRRQTLYDRMAGTVVLTGSAVEPATRLREAV